MLGLKISGKRLEKARPYPNRKTWEKHFVFIYNSNLKGIIIVCTCMRVVQIKGFSKLYRVLLFFGFVLPQKNSLKM
jgi:hypothetical protein